MSIQRFSLDLVTSSSSEPEYYGCDSVGRRTWACGVIRAFSIRKATTRLVNISDGQSVKGQSR